MTLCYSVASRPLQDSLCRALLPRRPLRLRVRPRDRAHHRDLRPAQGRRAERHARQQHRHHSDGHCQPRVARQPVHVGEHGAEPRCAGEETHRADRQRAGGAQDGRIRTEP